MNLGERPRRRVIPAVHQEAQVQAKELRAVKRATHILLALRVLPVRLVQHQGLLVQAVQRVILSLEAVILQDGQIIPHCWVMGLFHRKSYRNC